MFSSLDKNGDDQKMNLHFIFTVREVSEINDGKRTFTMPMYFALEWEVDLVNIFSK